MADYRLYFLDSAGHIVRREDLDFPTDQDAVEHARQYVNGTGLELWSRDRVVARLEPNMARSADSDAQASDGTMSFK